MENQITVLSFAGLTSAWFDVCQRRRRLRRYRTDVGGGGGMERVHVPR
jgi:hypothetical protein